jgi:uncharacterized membrane protein YcaP (DUF421 family)
METFPVKPFDWQRIWLGEDTPALFLLEVTFRSLVMYLLILATLRITGKRGVKQLSLFELTIILSLGSAAGDPMFYADVPLLHVLAVFMVVILCYVFFNRLSEKNQHIEQWLEGSSECILENGEIKLESFKKQNLTYLELFGEMRQQHVEHLGQIRRVYLEPTGEISIFFYEDEQVKPGLPIFPELLSKPFRQIERAGQYACRTCGHCRQLTAESTHICPQCGRDLWLYACTGKRLT